MNEFASILAAVIARPDDDLPRLIYADWLDEHAGDVPAPDGLRHLEGAGGTFANGYAERAEFIRVQCELARTPAANSATGRCTYCDETDSRGFVRSFPSGRNCGPCNCDCRHCALRRREREIVNKHYPQWTRTELPAPGDGRITWWCQNDLEPGVDYGGMYYPRVTYRRGFIESVALTAADWLAHGDAITAATPIEEVTLTTVPQVSWNIWPDGVPLETWCKGRWPRVKTWNLPDGGIPVPPESVPVLEELFRRSRAEFTEASKDPRDSAPSPSSP